MAEYKPLFPGELVRTRHYRKVIIRKTIQIARANPDRTDEEIAELAEREVAPLCDLCVESSFDDAKPHLVGRYFLDEDKEERQDHVGRFFIHRMEKQLRANDITKYLIPVFAQSVASLLGQEKYEDFGDRLQRLLNQTVKQGMIYQEALESRRGQGLIHEILKSYKREIANTPGFKDRLKNKMDAELVKLQSNFNGDSLNIVETVNLAYEEFLRLID
ncbi:MAG: hypothetical protein HZA02_03655 [Nitrospinae bacterium]|nr:hypothetical protein [Nitrospinota bacterium]